jgi:hypothetical protein
LRSVKSTNLDAKLTARTSFEPFFWFEGVRTGAKPETIDRGCPVQINRMFELKENLFFIVYIYFSVNQGGVPTLTGVYLDSATECERTPLPAELTLLG